MKKIVNIILLGAITLSTIPAHAIVITLALFQREVNYHYPQEAGGAAGAAAAATDAQPVDTDADEQAEHDAKGKDKADEESNQDRCVVCLDEHDDMKVLSCSHKYCVECLKQVVQLPNPCCPHSECKRPISSGDIRMINAEEVSADDHQEDDQHDQAEVECGVCLDEVAQDKMLKLSCNHSFCIDCLEDMVQSAIGDNTLGQLKCPARECTHTISYQDINKINTKSTVGPEKYKKWLAKVRIAAVADISIREWLSKQQPPQYIKQCPTPDCSYVFMNEDNYKKITCPSCNHTYCGVCLIEHDYENISCKTAYKEAQLSAQEKDEAQNERWKQANTKKCPKCATSIEKNDGCMHMTCTKCEVAFCWECLGLYEGTQYFHPNCKQSGPGAQAEPDEQAEEDEIVPYLPVELQEREREQRAQIQERTKIRQTQKQERQAREGQQPARGQARLVHQQLVQERRLVMNRVAIIDLLHIGLMLLPSVLLLGIPSVLLYSYLFNYN